MRVIKLNEKEMYELQYHQGFSDALASVTNVLQIMISETEKLYKKKEYRKILPVMGRSLVTVIEMWDEVNKRNEKFVERLANKHNITYNKDTQLIVDEDTRKIRKER